MSSEVSGFVQRVSRRVVVCAMLLCGGGGIVLARTAVASAESSVGHTVLPGAIGFELASSGAGAYYGWQRTYNAGADSIELQYGQGTYRNRDTGQVLQRMGIPGGKARCRFDGKRLEIDGKVFTRR